MKNISVTSLDLISQRLGFKNISFHKLVNVVVYYMKKYEIIYKDGMVISVDVNV